MTRRASWVAVALLAASALGCGEPEEKAAPVPPPAPAPVVPFRIEGTTTKDGVPAPARVVAERIGPPRDLATWDPDRDENLQKPPTADGTFATDSDAKGKFSLDVRGPGAFRVVATFEGGRVRVRLVDITEAMPLVKMGLVASEGKVRLAGRVKSSDGRPFAGWVRIEQQDHAHVRWTRSDAEGRYAFEGLFEETASLLVTDETGTWVAETSVSAWNRGATFTFPVAPTVLPYPGDFEFVMTSIDSMRLGRVAKNAKGGGAVEGRVVRVGSASPVIGAVVRARRVDAFVFDDEDEIVTRTGADGSFRLEHLPAGDTDVFVRGGGWASTGVVASVKRPDDPFLVRVDSGGTARVTLLAEPAARAEGRVVDAAGAPCPTLRVSVSTNTHSQAQDKWLQGIDWDPDAIDVEADGTFVFEDLVPGADCTFVAGPHRSWSLEGKSVGPIRLASGKTAQVEIRLDAERK